MAEPKIPTARYENLGGMNEKSSKYITGLLEFLNLVNYDLSTPGAITKRPGSTQYAFSGTSGTIIAMEELRRLSGFSQVVFAKANGLFSLQKGSTPMQLMPTFIASGAVDMEMFVDRIWIAGNERGSKYDGLSAFAIGLPTSGNGLTAISITESGTSTGVLLDPRYLFGFVNNRGYFGPAAVSARLPNRPAVGGYTSITILDIQGALATPTFTVADVASIFGATAIAIYRYDGADQTGSTGTSYSIQRFFHYTNIPIGATRFVDTLGSTLWQASARSILASEANPWVSFPFSLTIGSWIGPGSSLPLLAPRMLEIHQNSMFYSGYTLFPSNIYFSDIGDPETVEPDFNFEVRTNDGDIVRGMKAFGSQLLVFKENSMHKVVGDNPDNYELIEISTEYGCVNNKSAVTFRGLCMFLDPKGIAVYDGSTPRMASDKIEPTFRRMNLSAARDTACAAHYDFRSQVWFSIPVDGSTTNNLIVVYDYAADAWYKYEGINASALLRAEAGLNTKTILFGNASGMVHYMGPSLMSDNGTAFTLIAQPSFAQPQGPSAEALFRRLWLDVDSETGGSSGVVNVQLLKDFSNTGVTTMSVYQNAFQSRLEFGLQAKAIGFIFSHYSATLPCRINGWVVAHRWLRDL